MNLLNQLETSAHSEKSYFRAQLLKEDIGRLRQLHELTQSSPDFAAFKKQGTMIGWTPGDTRSWELKETLEPFLKAFYASEVDPKNEKNADVFAAWQAFDTHRMALLVGCLSRVPKPDID
jgi:hypothetical protein